MSTFSDYLKKPQSVMADAFVAAWLPGTEGNGISDLLFGDYDFSGRLPMTWFAP